MDRSQLGRDVVSVQQIFQPAFGFWIFHMNSWLELARCWISARGGSVVVPHTLLVPNESGCLCHGVIYKGLLKMIAKAGSNSDKD